MERENYYLLLELTVDPPENDSRVIDAAIKKKQSQWSRYRNHPTKSIQAKQYIGMIPDIRNVMGDPELRKQEAEEAKKTLHQQETEKFSKTDRHIELLMSKGSVTKTEISGIAKLDSVEEKFVLERIKKNEKLFKIDQHIQKLMRRGPVKKKQTAKLAKQYAIGEKKILERIKAKEEEKFSEIDAYLNTCAERGFIYEEEIEKLAKIYNIKENLILSRIECPMKTEGADDKKLRSFKPLDKTLEKLIHDNLKIVGASSLYEFLAVAPDSNLEFLQEIAREKEIEIRKIGQKDAVMTASGALAGHCIVIFNTKKSKNAYDLSLKRTRLTELDADINIAGIDGKIRADYFDILIRRALSFGMEINAAFDYIYEYCEREKWAVEERKKWVAIRKKKIIFREKWSADLDPRKPSFWILTGSVAAAFLIMITSVMVTGKIIKAARLKSAYENVLESLENQKDLEKKEKVVRDFLNRYSNTKYAPVFRQKIKEIQTEIEKRDYEDAVKRAKALAAKKKFEEIEVIYEAYVKKYPMGAHADQIRKELAKIPEQIDDRDFELLETVANSDYTERIKAYNWYFDKHPSGKHSEGVRKLILEMVAQYYEKLQNDLNLCENQREWEKCIALCADFIESFKGTEQAITVEGFQIKYQKRLRYEKDIAEMQEKEKLTGYDFDAAKQIYAEYLNANLELPEQMKDLVKKELARVERAQRKYIQDEKEWERLLAYSKDSVRDLGDRVGKLEIYIEQNQDGRHVEEAKSLLSGLKEEYKQQLKEIAEEKELKQWEEILTAYKNPQMTLTDKIRKAQGFIKQYPAGKHTENAKTILEDLKKKKEIEDELIRREKERIARIQREEQKMKQFVKNSRRYIDNGNRTITDKNTGLMWCLLDSSAELNTCTDYQTTLEYVSSLTTGGYKDWRLPTLTELVGIYKTEPFFPDGDAKWFWTSEIVWHGWNKTAIVVTSAPETAWRKEQVDLSKCGWVRAVRQ